MKNTSIPDRIGTVFASSGQYNDIGTTSSTSSLAAGTATYDVGFPPLTMTAISSGGVPPAGRDMNGILYDITQKLQWSDAGMGSPFDSTFAASISGYPAGAVVPSSDYSGFWQNTVDGNTTSPENSSGASTGWVPHSFYGSTSVTASSSSITLTSLQAARDEIVVSGTLTANIYLYVPAWIKTWRIINNCTGSYSVIISTSGGTSTVPSYPGNVLNIRCNGSGIYRVQPCLLSSSGYQYMDSGLLIQWGTIAIVPGNSATVNYPVAFQNAAFMGVASKGSAITTGDYACGIDVSKTYALITNGSNVSGSTGTQGIRWIVIGY